MLSLVRCTFPQQRRSNSKHWPCFALAIFFIVSPFSSAADQQVHNHHELSSYSPVPLDTLTSGPTLSPGLSSLPEDFDSPSANYIPQINQITYQDSQASQSQQTLLQAPNILISPGKYSNQWLSASSHPSISTQAQTEQARSLKQSNTYEEHSIGPEAQRMLLEVQVSHLTKRQQLDTSSNPAQYFPQPFDTSLGTEFDSDTCQPFMSKFLNNPSFQDCHPFSLLLTTSDSFFRAYSALNSASNGAQQLQEATSMSVQRVLDAACRVDVNQCAVLFDELAASINSSTIGCGKDLMKQNSLPLQALEGLKNYRLMREVSCLTVSESQRVSNGTHAKANSTLAHESTSNPTLNSTQLSVKYCFEKAVSSAKPDDLYYYYLPLGTSLPSGTQSSCDQCIRSIMKLYSVDASDHSLALSNTYLSARTMTNSECGPGFAPLPINKSNRLASTAHRPSPVFSLKFSSWMFIILYPVLFPV